MENLHLFSIDLQACPQPNCSADNIFKLVWYVRSEAALQRCPQRKVLWKYAANLQENTHADKCVSIKFISKSLTSHFGMDVLL